MKKIFLTTISFFVLLLTTSILEASQLPRFLGSEKKFRSYIYNPNYVYRYTGHYTYQGFIEFAEDEAIGTISMGNPSLWLFEHLGNRLFLKPVGEDNSETNMTVITNKRIYHFELMAKEAKNINDKDLIFVAKFSYPDDKEKNLVALPKTPTSDRPDMRDLSIYNFDYKYTGEPSIAPIKVFDNGEFTYFQFARKNAEVPAIFTVDSAGFESLVNFRSVDEFIIVEKVSPQFTLRSGSDIVCVYNGNMYSSGKKINGTPRSIDPAITDSPLSNPYSSGTNSYEGINMSPSSQTMPSLPMQPSSPTLPNLPQNPSILPQSGQPSFGNFSMPNQTPAPFSSGMTPTNSSPNNQGLPPSQKTIQ
jgi:type IV secretion system protein VirB9